MDHSVAEVDMAEGNPRKGAGRKSLLDSLMWQKKKSCSDHPKRAKPLTTAESMLYETHRPRGLSTEQLPQRLFYAWAHVCICW